MGVWDYLERLRKKPVEERRMFAFTLSAVLTGVIAVTWVTMLFASFGRDEKVHVPSQTASPFESFKSQFASWRKASPQDGDEVILEEVTATTTPEKTTELRYLRPENTNKPTTTTTQNTENEIEDTQ